MAAKRIIYDREGRIYEVNDYEADGLLASGAYFVENPKQGNIEMNAILAQNIVIIYETKTGKKLMRRPVDARELVATGEYSFEAPQKKAEEKKPEGNTPPPQKPESLPKLSEENSKQEIMAVLSKYNVQYRSNMDKEALLQLWNDFQAENEKGE